MFNKIPAIILAAVTLGLAGAGPCKALEEPKVYRGVLVLEGKIEAGDYDKLHKFLSNKATFDKINGGVFLASPGGNLVEAMRIGRLVRALRLSTTAPSGPSNGGRRFGESLVRPDNLHDGRNYLCTSACFLIFISGIYRDLNWAGRLGVHRPFQMKDGVKVPANDQSQFDVRLRRAMDDYLREMNVRIKYVGLMFSTPSTEVRWITQEELDSDIQGFIPDLKDQAAARCAGRDAVGSAQKVAAAGKAPETMAACEVQVQTQLRAELPAEGWQKVYGGK